MKPVFAFESTCASYNVEGFKTKLGSVEKRLSAIHFNARSTKHKGDHLNLFFASIKHTFDFLVFTEAWLTSHEDHPHFDNYTYNGLLRPHCKGGGLAVYVNKLYKHSVIDEFCVVDSNVECITVSTKNVLVVAIYRPPTGNKRHFFDFLENLLMYLTTTGRVFIIMGDININLLSNDLCATQFNNTIASFACWYCICLPTRVTVETSSLLDVCITNMVQFNNILSGVLSYDISDHLPIFYILPVIHDIDMKVSRLYREINANTMNMFRTLIESAHWDNVYDTTDVNKAYAAFIEQFLRCYNKAFPLKEIKACKKFKKPSMTRELYKRIKTKNHLYHKFVKSRDANTLIEFKKIRK